MKILHLLPNLGVGGTEKIVLELCRFLDRNKFQNKVISLKSGGETMEELKKIPVPVVALKSADSFVRGLLEFPRIYLNLRSAIEDFSPDIVHTWLTRANVVGRLAARGAAVPVVISSLRVMEEEKRYHLWAECLTQKLSRAVTVNCTALKEFAAGKIGIPENKIVLIPNGIQIAGRNVNAARVESFRKEWQLKENEIAIGALGRLHKQKGMDLFLRAAQVVLKKFPGCRFLVAGEGPEKENLAALSRKLNIEPRVTFCGLVREPAEFLSAIDLFVLASRWEGMPNVILEAMLMKKPIAASRAGGVTDMIDDGKEGVLFDAGNVSSCAEALISLASDAGVRERMGRSAYEKVVQNFSLEKMISSYSSLYESLAKN